MAILDLEPTWEEIEEAVESRYGAEYRDAMDAYFWNGDRNTILDLECMVEQELIREKRLQAEFKDAIVSV